MPPGMAKKQEKKKKKGAKPESRPLRSILSSRKKWPWLSLGIIITEICFDAFKSLKIAEYLLCTWQSSRHPKAKK